MKRLIAVLFALALVCTFGLAATPEAIEATPDTAMILDVAVELEASCANGYCTDCHMLNWGFDDDGVWGIWQCHNTDTGDYCATCFLSVNASRSFCAEVE